ncbi:hypothetical protein [Paraburkholderia diazotrophica]|uniref:Lipoprotein n=1 Tax=Paraburkholderia diazotrophica TaxID=667676 RepID=A0A1H6QM14_9BURK|nr:hypothetical protein [Paraburkholderia diazotrophica]SEI42996.1 hypothetical protein SAMN05192539_1001343 [Paraburkholderia diazotrophica]
MKKLMLLAAGIVASAFLIAGCSTTQQADASAKLAQLQTVVNNGCVVVQPTLVAVAAIDPVVSAAATANGLFCATAGAISVTSVQALISTGIPAIDKAVTESTLIPANQKPLVVAALGVFQLTVANALAVYGNAATTDPASDAASASAPVAASQ